VETLTARWLGRIRWRDAFALQTDLAAARAAGEIGDTVLLLEHDAVYTRRASDAEILLDEAALRAEGIEVEHADRGGRVTYHGPGQLVGYPIIDLGPTGDLVAYVRRLETVLIDTCAAYGVTAGTVEGITGAWVGEDKIGQIGVHVSRGITTHGFALNVAPDLTHFTGIIPCGITDRGVTSIAALTGAAPEIRDVATTAATTLAASLGRALTWQEAHAHA
jgi:lipoyl(octanoyl) transferase